MQGAGFTVAGVAELLGEAAHAALGRNETTPALRRAVDGSPLATLTRLWPLQAEVSADDAERALPGIVDALCAGGLLQRSVGAVRALVDVRPYADELDDWWIVSDLTPGLDGGERRMRPDHVLGVSSASNSLAQLVPRAPVDSALDLGTGSGVQAMHLARHVDRVVATDVNDRCLQFAGLTARLNQVDVDLRRGSLYDPVAGEAFDLIVTNPPFVISPATGERLVYRDSGLPGDEVVARVVTGAAHHLNPGGWCQVLANWAHVDGVPWEERVGGWVAATGCDAWVVQREQIDVARYVEMWLDDAGLRGAPDYVARYDAWLGWFADQRISSIGFGWLSLRNAGRSHPSVRVEAWPFDVEQPLAPHIASWADRVDALDARPDDALGRTRLRVDDTVVEERIGAPGAEDPTHILLRQQRGLRRARQLTTAEAAFVGACDGDLTVDQIIGALALLLDEPEARLRALLLDTARELVLDGFLDVP